MSANGDRIHDLVAWLNDHCKDSGSLISDVAQRLQVLKELSRKKEDASALYTARGMSTMLRYAFPLGSVNYSPVAEAEARRCLANALTLEDRCVNLFCQEDGIHKTMSSIQNRRSLPSFGEEFLYARILFLVTGKGGNSIQDYVCKEESGLCCVVKSWLERHEARLDNGQEAESDPALTALTETLKLTYNILIFFPKLIERLTPSSDMACWTVDMISKVRKHKELEVRSVLPHFVNLLASTTVDLKSIVQPQHYTTLLEVMDEYVQAALQREAWNELKIGDEHLVPLFSVVCNLQQKHLDDTSVQSLLRERLLVPASERHVALGKSASAQARLLQLLNCGTMQVRESIGALLYQVSGSSPSKFVEHVGYGHAIGFLTSHGLAVPPEDIPAAHAGEYINPVTGQNLRDEEADAAQRALQEMTEEEQEREAEKLFVLFQRLKKNGVINVKDPIQQAVDDGRFEEI